MSFLFRVCALFPLLLLHGIGAVLGVMAYGLSRRYRQQFRRNANLAQLNWRQRMSAISNAGKMACELPRLWLGKPVPIVWLNQAVFEQAHQDQRGLIFLTPHLGCFEITAQAIARVYAPQGRTIHVLYTPARQAWLEDLMARGRAKPGMQARPASLSGVKALVKALRSGQALGMLPDQVPPLGMGVDAPFFGQTAYTMTLPIKLAQQTAAQIILVWGRRLAWGRGYQVHFSALPESLSSDLPEAAAQINRAMEQLVRQCPEQYLWGYARYKRPVAFEIPSQTTSSSTGEMP